MMDEDKARWRRLVADWESSDVTQREYAQERGISVHGLRYWLYRFRKESRPLVVEPAEQSPAAEKKDLRLVPVHLVASAPEGAVRGTAAGLLELTFPSGAQLRFPSGTDVDYLRAVAAVLQP